jgi:hypothetical protein
VTAFSCSPLSPSFSFLPRLSFYPSTRSLVFASLGRGCTSGAHGIFTCVSTVRRPTSLDKLDYHDDLTVRLTQLAQSGDLPHLLFYGPSGAGKKTRVIALLRELYGAGVERLKTEHKVYKVGSKKIDTFILNSLYHMEINVADAGSWCLRRWIGEKEIWRCC